MSLFEDPEKVRRRRLLFQKMAQLEIAQKKKEQLKAIEEENKNKPSTSAAAISSTSSSSSKVWLTGHEKQRYDSDQFLYVEPYRRAFEGELLNNSRQDANNSSDILDQESTATGSPASARAPPRKYCPTSNLPQHQQVAEENEENDCPASVCSDRDSSVRSLNYSQRGRSSQTKPRGRGGAFLARSSVCAFDATSTVMAPTVVQQNISRQFDDDYTSSVSIGELQKAYFSKYKTNTTLPIYGSRDYLVNSIYSYNVVIVEGATGCGKTTQVPMYILEDAILGNPNSEQPSPVIYVTQPRRIAARSIARRVCEEHGWELGSIVGYQVGLDRVAGPQTVLTFCTAGVLLQKLITDKSLSNYSHIIIDEVHERDADTDLLMMMIRTLMRREKSFFRLIIMSATMDISRLKTYYTCQIPYGHSGLSNPSICKVGHEAMKPIEIMLLYFDKLRTTFEINVPMPDFKKEEPMAHDTCFEVAVKLILQVIPKLDTYDESSKSTLVFLPGLSEITKLHCMLRENGCPEFIKIVPLHSCLSTNDQAKVFEPMKPGYRKVILATNIAESSITVKDVGFIIDFCLTKILVKDPVTRFPILKLHWTTKDKSTQRAGRTGRCCRGKVFRLVPHDFYNSFDAFATPELLMAPLELSVLRVKNFHMGELKALFALVLDPPPLKEIRLAVLELKQIGALSSTFYGKINDLDGDLTELGKIISILPIDVHLSKLIVIASILGVLNDAIIVAACLSTNRSVVRHIYGDPFETYVNKLNWARGSNSDLFIGLDVYKEFYHYKFEQKKSQDYLRRYCDTHLLDERKLLEVVALVEEITNRLEQINIQSTFKPNLVASVDDRCVDELMLKVAFCAAFYPNYFLEQEFDTQDVSRAFCTLDPTKTVIIGNLPLGQVPLYYEQIYEQVKDKISPNIDYLVDSSRALLVINEQSKLRRDENSIKTIGENVVQVARPIDQSVYLALKLSQCPLEKLAIRPFQPDAAHDRMQYYKNAEKELDFEGLERCRPPWAMIVRGRRADNSRLLESSLDDYYKYITKENYYMEINLDERQSRMDMAALWKFETEEEATMKHMRMDKKGNKPNLASATMDPEHPIFKKENTKVYGPTSPIQMKFLSILEKSRCFSVEIDPLSVNSILLDPDYEKKHNQLLVAASVGQQSRGGSKVTARDTTLMPNVRGLPTLMALMFAQYYRLVYNQHIRCFSGAIFGLGWDENDQPIDRDYEVELDFDIHLTRTDIELINETRRIMSALIRNIDLVKNPGQPREQQQQLLRDIILKLMKTIRYPLTSAKMAGISYLDEGFIRDKHNVPEQQLEQLREGSTRNFLPIMESTIDFLESDMYSAIRENLDLLKKIDAYEAKPPLEGIYCLLCGSGRSCLFQMQREIYNHLISFEHEEKLKVFESFESRAKESSELEQSLFESQNRQ